MNIVLADVGSWEYCRHKLLLMVSNFKTQYLFGLLTAQPINYMDKCKQFKRFSIWYSLYCVRKQTVCHYCKCVLFDSTNSTFFIRLLFFRSRLNIIIFLPILGWKYMYSCAYFYIITYDISVFECIWCLDQWSQETMVKFSSFGVSLQA